MGVLTGLLVFVIIWWVALFAVLPWGVETDAAPAPGMAQSAPKKPRIVQKMLITTLISLAIWLAIYFAVAYSGFSFREWAKTM